MLCVAATCPGACQGRCCSSCVDDGWSWLRCLGVMSHGLMYNCARVFFVKIPSSQAQYAVVAPHRALCIVAARTHRINCALTTSAPRAETSARVTPEHLCFVMSIAPSTETRCHTSQCGMEKYLLVKYIYIHTYLNVYSSITYEGTGDTLFHMFNCYQYRVGITFLCHFLSFSGH